MSPSTLKASAGEVLEELSLLEREHPNKARRLLDAFRSIWSAPTGPEKTRLMKTAQSLIEELWDQQLQITHSKELLARYIETYTEMEAIQAQISSSPTQIEECDLSSLTTKPTSVLEELWDNDSDSIYDDL